MRGPRRVLYFFPFRFGFFLFTLVLLFLLPLVVLTVGAVLDFSTGATVVLFIAIVLGSAINIPLMELDSDIHVSRADDPSGLTPWTRWFPDIVDRKKTIVAANLGGGIIPAAVSVYFLATMPLVAAGSSLIAFIMVAIFTYRTSRLVPGLGISLSPLVPASVSALTSALLLHAWGGGFAHLAQVTFVAGVFGVIVGADLFNLPNVSRLGARVVSIGGAGTFDGIFLTGILGVFLSAFLTL